MSRHPTTASSSSPAPASLSGQPQQRNSILPSPSASFIGRRFGRRPKTTQSYSHDGASLQSPAFSASSSDLPSHLGLRDRSGLDRNGLPRSASSSHVAPFSAAQTSETSQHSAMGPAPYQPSGHRSAGPPRFRPATASEVSQARDPPSSDFRYSSGQGPTMHNGSGAHTTNGGGSNGANGGGGGSNPFGRMFRRYSQGAGRSEGQSQTHREPSSPHGPQGNRGSSHLAENRGRSTPPRLRAHGSRPTSAGVPRSASHNSIPPTANDSPGISNSRTLAVLADESAVSHAASDADLEPNGATDESGTALPGSAAFALAPAAAVTGGAAESNAGMPSNVHRIRLVPHLEASRSLHFEPIERDVREGNAPVKVGRFTDRQPPNAADATVANGGTTGHEAGGSGGEPAYASVGQPGARGGAVTVSGALGGAGRIDSSRVAFKSKVVSRGHAEIWCEVGGKFFIKDTKSSSGTFLNHIRLSAPNVESRPFSIKDGDVIQLGVDYQGGTEEIFRCVKMRVELNRGWQREANQFNVNALRQLRALQGTPIQASGANAKDSSAALPTNRQGVSVTDCCICLFSVTVCQALFIAPCSHVFHYKCIRPMLTLHHPGFSCPLCRTFADLEADVEEDEAWQEALLKEATAAETRAAQGQPALDVATPRVETEAPIALASALEEPLPITRYSAAASADDAAIATGGPHRSPMSSTTERGTANSAQRRAEWARPETAVGSSTGPLLGTTDVLDAAARLDVDRQVEPAGSIDAADAEELAVVDHILDERSSNEVSTDLQTAVNGSLAALRRGSGPIEIGRGAQGRIRTSGEVTTDSTYALAARINALHASSPATFASMSPGLDEARTPLNNTFLSTLAEAPVAPSQSRDFQVGRTAPADSQMPSTIQALAADGRATTRHKPRRSSDEAVVEGSGGSGGGLSEGGDETETAENPLFRGQRLSSPSSGGDDPTLLRSAHQGNGKDKARASGSSSPKSRSESPDVASHRKPVSPQAQIPMHPAQPLQGSPSARHARHDRSREEQRPRSRSRSRYDAKTRLMDFDDSSAAPSSPSPPGVRTGPNINASAYMHNNHPARSQFSPSRDASGGNDRGPSGVTRQVPSSSSSAMAKFKRKFSSGAA